MIPYAIKHLKYILSLYDLSNKEITKILEEYNDPNDDFDGKIERLLRYNRVLAKILKTIQFKKYKY